MLQCSAWVLDYRARGLKIPIFENVANLDKLPDNNIFVIALPMKIKGGSGGPLRIIAKVL